MTTTSGENLRACAAKHHPRIVGALRGLEDARRVPAEARGPRPQGQRPVWGYPDRRNVLDDVLVGGLQAWVGPMGQRGEVGEGLGTCSSLTRRTA